MAVRQREYLFSVNEFKEPDTLVNKSAIALLLVRLIMMEPGVDPLRPNMGVGIVRYRYGMNNLDELKRNVEYQIETYLPCYQNATVSIIVTEEKLCNIEITIDDIVYVYDSATAPISISVDDIKEN